jgi:hypothetical protein
MTKGRQYAGSYKLILNAIIFKISAFDIDSLDCWSQEDDELTMQYPCVLRRQRDRDTISQVITDSF